MDFAMHRSCIVPAPMTRGLPLLMAAVALLVALVACGASGVSFGAGAKPAPPPEKFSDVESERALDDKKSESALLKANKPDTSLTPAVGLSVVVGGSPLDAGALPPPPIPIRKP